MTIDNEIVVDILNKENGISILNTSGIFLYANDFFINMMGYTMQELYKESCISLSSKEYIEPSKQAVKDAIKYGNIQNFRKVCITKSGTHLNASMSLRYIKEKNHIVMITSNITDDIRYQEELQKQVEQEVLKRTQQYKVLCHQSRLAGMGEMIDSIAHQWRQPLNSMAIIIKGLKHLSKQKEFDYSLLKEIEDEIVNKISYMSQTIDDFSTFFRISKKKEYFNILESINDSIRLINVQLDANNIQININLDDTLDLKVLGFANEFRQVILNMIHNSMMAIVDTKQINGYINISIYLKDNNKVIEIIDNGKGIEEKYLEKIFDPYFTTKQKGSGIGLYMSKVIIEHHMQGSLVVQNYKSGAKFTIKLPL